MDVVYKEALTKVVCTIGPSTSSRERIGELISAGMSIARINLSHGLMEEYLEVVREIRRVRESAGRYVAIALDTRGPETRINTPGGRSIRVSAGDILRFTTSPSRKLIQILSPIKLGNLKKDDMTFIDDGLLALRITGVQYDGFTCEALNGHVVQSNKSMNFPGVDLGLQSLSERDRADILLGLECDIDFVFASFVNSPSDVEEIRRVLGSRDVRIVSKIESLRAMNSLEEIVAASDGVMAARGDLGVEIGIENIFSAQREIFAMARKHRRPVICATQMMESMIDRSIPNRSEVSDVGGAVLAGCDCVMLSGETAVGMFPIRVVDFMRRICLDAEAYVRRTEDSLPLCRMFPGVTSILAVEASMSRIELMYLANLMLPIVAVSTDRRMLGRLCIYRGVVPVLNNGCEEPVEILRRLGLRGECMVVENGQVAIKTIL